ncbi:phage virion morphogenesis protein [Obesumbacterium proteus]|uniref:phage virion morphogenesis protein n=1 Tax=Obesumbacterium proteus TaxID=82983 RepID=UPI003AF364C5
MFQTLRTSRYMKVSGRSDAVVGKVQRIVQLHHYSFKEQIKSHAERVYYPKSQLLGFSHNGIRLIGSIKRYVKSNKRMLV